MASVTILFAMTIMSMAGLSVAITAASDSTSDWTVFEGHQCEAIGGMTTDLLRDWNGTVEQCKAQCIELGSDCVGFIRVHNGSSFAGMCHFRSTALQDPYPYSSDDRDCYIRNVFGVHNCPSLSIQYQFHID